MPELELKTSSSEFVAVAVAAELEGLITFVAKPPDTVLWRFSFDSLLRQPNGSLQVLELTEAGCAWNEEHGLMGRIPKEREDDLELMDAVLVMFFAMYSREIGLPLMPDATIHELLDTAEATKATLREWKETLR